MIFREVYMKRIVKSLLALLIAMSGLLYPLKVRAGHYLSVYIKDMSGYQITAFQVYEGDSLLETFHQYPQFLKEINQQDDGRMPVFYQNQSYVPYDPNEPIFTHTTLYITYAKAINSIRLKLTWPLAGQTAVYPDLSIRDSNPKYTLSSMRWLKNYTDTVAYTGTMYENQTYWAEIYIYPQETYGLNYFNNTLKVTINGLEASYTKNTVPDEGIRILFKVKVDDKVESFVRRLYILCLGREPDPSGFTNWVTKLKNKTATASDIIYGFFNSTEFKNYGYLDSEFIELCYNVMMDRTGDTGGQAYWFNKMRQGLSRNYVLKGFVDSVEFHQLCKKYGIEPGTIKLTEARDQNPGLTAFIARMYTRALGRDYDVNGVNYWCQQVLSKKKTPKDVAVSFFNSAEFLNKYLGNHAFVGVLYRTFMDREPDSSGWAYWEKKLDEGMSRNSVIAGFADSKEFANIMKSYGL